MLTTEEEAFAVALFFRLNSPWWRKPRPPTLFELEHLKRPEEAAKEGWQLKRYGQELSACRQQLGVVRGLELEAIWNPRLLERLRRMEKQILADMEFYKDRMASLHGQR